MMLDYNMLTIFAHMLISFVVTCVIGAIGLPMLQKIKAGQYVRDEGPKAHHTKSGTPTMGGWFFILGILFVVVGSNFFIAGTPQSLWFYLLTLVSYAVIGFIDDFLKVILKQNLGLRGRQKLLLQIISVLILFLLFRDRFENPTINLIFVQLPVPVLVHLVFSVFWFVGFSNATNLTDGLDGLLGITAAIAFLSFGVIAFMLDNTGTAMFCSVTIGALFGFLVFNRHPARVFMGDTGSLALGALLAAMSIDMKMEFYLLLIGIVFVVETFTVMLQVVYFKYTKRKYGKGVRIFLMSPIHHHLELVGFGETKVVLYLSLLGIIGGLTAIGLTYVLR